MASAALRPDEYAVYSVLFDEGAQSPSELARRVGMPPTTMSHYVRAMLAQGHARKSAHPNDRRSFRLELTRSGRAVHAAAGRAFADADRRFLGALRIDEEELRASLRATAAAAELALQRLEEAAADVGA
jgi:DNA-binding MarR family transcriptional regulator